ncbi:MAG: carboxymuconolactone decarboxylase family protein [Ilumatobacteraceae bacterium]
MTRGERLTTAGRATAIEMFGDEGPARLEAAYERREASVDTSWADITSSFITNGMYSRNVLTTATRELCAVAALTALGRTVELSEHIRIAMRTSPASHVREAIIQMSVYAGMPAVFDGLRLFEEVVATMPTDDVTGGERIS